jgi:hypothetical protein
MIWRASTDKFCDWFNKPWLNFVGRTMQQELGNGWAEGAHKEDFDRLLPGLHDLLRRPEKLQHDLPASPT